MNAALVIPNNLAGKPLKVVSTRYSSSSGSDVDLSKYLNKTTGGIISGDVGILSGNFIQTSNDSEYVKNYSYKNSFIQAEYVEQHPEWGIACAGSKGYCMLAIYPDLSAIKLSGDISMLSNNLDKKYSWALGSYSDSEALTISSIDIESQLVYFGHRLPSKIAELSNKTEEYMILLFEYDDNALYCPRNPTIGNVVIHNFYANHAEGGSVKAIGKYAHAEGRNTIADNRYTHAEGDSTFAGKMAAHAEGQETSAYGYYSHAEGQRSYVANNATAGHTEGYATSALASYSHAAGLKACASASYSYVWNGTNNQYVGHNKGSFSINPQDGLSGFWIGNQNLGEIIGDIETVINNL